MCFISSSLIQKSRFCVHCRAYAFWAWRQGWITWYSFHPDSIIKCGGPYKITLLAVILFISQNEYPLQRSFICHHKVRSSLMVKTAWKWRNWLVSLVMVCTCKLKFCELQIWSFFLSFRTMAEHSSLCDSCDRSWVAPVVEDHHCLPCPHPPWGDSWSWWHIPPSDNSGCPSLSSRVYGSSLSPKTYCHTEQW